MIITSIEELEQKIKKLDRYSDEQDLVLEIEVRGLIDSLKEGLRKVIPNEREIGFLADLIYLGSYELTKPCYGLSIEEIEAVYYKLKGLRRVLRGEEPFSVEKRSRKNMAIGYEAEGLHSFAVHNNKSNKQMRCPRCGSGDIDNKTYRTNFLSLRCKDCGWSFRERAKDRVG